MRRTWHARTFVSTGLLLDLLTLTLSFGLVALAAHRIGRWATAIRLPYITGYLATGALVGSFGLDLIPTEAVTDLRWVDQVSLGVIAFVAGSELYVPDIRPQLRTIARVAAGVVGIGLLLLGPAIFVGAGLIDGGAGLTGEGRVAVAILGGIVLLALSPPSTIAVIKEARARGPFTSTSLSVTVLMDVLVVVLFAAGTSIVAALLHNTGLDVLFVLVLAVDIALALGIGVAVGYGLAYAVRSPLPRVAVAGVVLVAGWTVHAGASWLDAWTLANFPVELHLEPLLVCMVAGFTVTNRTAQRADFEHILHDISPAVYVAFFVVTGLGLKLDILLEVLPVALGLFAVRLVALYVGARVGSSVDAPNSFRRLSWMAFVTQAGIALGLAREATVEFPELGASFATLIIAVVVLNEVFGPLFLKRALDRAGESRAADAAAGGLLVYGLDRRLIGMAERLRTDGWQILLADRDDAMLDDARGRGFETLLLDVDGPDLQAVLDATGQPVDVVVVTSADDRADLAVATAAVKVNPAARVVARVAGPEHVHDFDELDAIVIDHTAAVTGLLEQAVRTPAAVELVFPTDRSRRTAELVVPRAWPGRALRELRLPDDVLVVEVRRDGTSAVPDGFTQLRSGDVLTLLGTASAIEETRARMSSTSAGQRKSGHGDESDSSDEAGPSSPGGVEVLAPGPVDQ